MPRDIARLIAVLPVKLACGEPLRAKEQRIILPKLQEVRALPHVTKIPQTMRRLTEELPPLRRFFIDEHRAPRLFFIRLRTEHHIAPPVTLKEIGVTEMRRKPNRICLERKLLFFHRAISHERTKAL